MIKKMSFSSKKIMLFYNTVVAQLGKKLVSIVNTCINIVKLLNNLQTCIHQIGKEESF